MMCKLDEIKEMNFKITWKLIKIGYTGYKFMQPQINKQEICEYAYSLLEKMECNYEYIAQLIGEKENDYEFNQILDKLSKLDSSDIELQYQKWIIYLTKKLIESLDHNELENLLNITEFWISLGQPDNSPHIFQAVGNKITPEAYYTKEMYDLVLHRHLEWIGKETQKIIQLENR